MKKIFVFLILFMLISFSFNAIADLSHLNDNSSVYRVSDCGVDTIDFYDRVHLDDDKFIVFCSNWCPLSYIEFNRLYAQGIIDSLTCNNVSLIILSDIYPFLNLNCFHIEGDWNKRISRDFEIYYDSNFSILKHISGGASIPFFMLIIDGNIVKQNLGLKENYLDIMQLITDKKQNQCIKSDNVVH